MRAIKFITGHVIYNPAYTYKFQLKTTIVYLSYVRLAVQCFEMMINPNSPKLPRFLMKNSQKQLSR